MPEFSRCIFLLADGSRPDVFRRLLQSGDLPHIARHIVEPGSFKTATTCFPSITGPAYMPFLMGCYPSTCNIPGIRWLDKTQFDNGRFSGHRFRSYVGIESLYMNRDLNPATKTVFELIDHSHNVFSPIYRGANNGKNHTKFPKHWYYWLLGHWTNHWSHVDAATARIVTKILDKDFQYIYGVFPAIDEYSHLDGPFSDNTMAAYRKFDATIGRIVDKLKAVGRLDDTLLVIASDHGLTETHQHFELWEFINSLGYRSFYYPKIFMKGFDAATMVSGNAMAHLYFKHPDGWRHRVSHDDFADRVIPALVARPEISIVLSRGADESVHVTSKAGAAHIREENGAIHYQIAGADPFGYTDYPTVTTAADSLQRTFDTQYPDGIVQALQIFRSCRSGDVIVCAENGFDLRDEHENPEHVGSHGSLDAEHIHVPILMNHRLAPERFRTIDVFPTVLDLIGIPYDRDGIDGRTLL